MVQSISFYKSLRSSASCFAVPERSEGMSFTNKLTRVRRKPLFLPVGVAPALPLHLCFPETDDARWRQSHPRNPPATNEAQRRQ